MEKQLLFGRQNSDAALPLPPAESIHLWALPPRLHMRLPASPGGPHPSLVTRPRILAFLILWNVPSFWLTWPQALVVGMRQELACCPGRDMVGGGVGGVEAPDELWLLAFLPAPSEE